MTFPVHESISTPVVQGYGTSVTPTIPAGTVAGDQLIAVIACDFTRVISTTDGWTELVTHTYTNNVTMSVFTFTAVGSDTNPTFNIDAGNEPMIATIIRATGHSGVTAATPTDTAGTVLPYPAHGTAAVDSNVYRIIAVGTGIANNLVIPGTSLVNQATSSGSGEVTLGLSWEQVASGNTIDSVNATQDVSENSVLMTIAVQGALDPRRVDNIDVDNSVQAGQTGVIINGAGFGTVSSVTLGGEALTVNSNTATTVNVDVPEGINLAWGSTNNQLIVTDETSSLTLGNLVTLTPATGWEVVAYDGVLPDEANTESYYEEAKTDLSHTMVVGDILAFQSATGLSVSTTTYPTITPPATVTGNYKIWNSVGSTWTATSSYTWTDAGYATPTISNPTGFAVYTDRATGTVDTNIPSGTLYYYVSENPTETAVTIKANGLTEVITSGGTKTVLTTGLTPLTTYYYHFVQTNDGEDSNVVSSTSFITIDGIAPILTNPTATSTGTTTALGTVSSDDSVGILYTLASQNATELVSTVKANGDQKAVTAAGLQTATVSGLTANTTYYIHFVHTDTNNNDSLVSTSPQFTTDVGGDITPPVLSNATGIATSSTTATVTVDTDEGNGTLYVYATTNPTETTINIKVNGQQQAVTAAGTISIDLSGLTASTTYYAHFVHEDAASNESNVIVSPEFTTSATTVDDPVITNIDGDNDVYPGQVCVINGNNFGTVTGSVALDGVLQQVNAWTNTAITVTIIKGAMDFGTGKQLVVTLP